MDDTAGGTDAGSATVFTRSGSVWSQQQQLLASGGLASDQFGISVALSGDTALVGANQDDITAGGTNAGSATVFTRSGSVWSQQQQLTASDGRSNDRFGLSVALSGDTALVGARDDDTAAGNGAGSAYVFVRSAGLWTQQQQLTASDGLSGDGFGASVALSGDTALVGANFDTLTSPTRSAAGSAYVFVRSAAVWTQQQKLTASDALANDQFGNSVALSGDTALVGAWFDDTAGGTNAGSAYVFERSAGLWTQQGQLIASDGSPDNFGISVALSGDTALVGAPFHDTAGGLNAGAAYVYVRSAGLWTEQQQLTAADGLADDLFGYSVAVSGDTALVGARDDDTTGGNNAGSVTVFVRNAGLWTQQQQLTASDGLLNDGFGVSVALSGDTALVGAAFNDTAGGTNAGSAYVFVRSAGLWTEQQQLTASDGLTNDDFGRAVALSGDTALVGANQDDAAGDDAGSAHVFIIPRDFGDAPSTYATLLADDGPRHATGSLFLGALIDSETDGQPHSGAVGDDLAGVDDEDGVSFGTLTAGQPATVTVTVTGGSGQVDLWLDRDGAGPFNSGDKVISGAAVVTGPNNLNFTVPADATAGTRFARVRLTSAGIALPTGAADDGEVEDEQVTMLILDTTGPTVTIDQAAGQPDPSNDADIDFTVVFDESTTQFSSGDVTLGGAAGATTAVVTGSGTTYNVAVSGMTGNGTVTATVNAAAITDLAGNASAASTSADNTVTFDAIAPTVTINQAAGQADPSNDSDIDFTVVFSEATTQFTAADVTLGGTAGATTKVVTGSGTTYNVAVSGMTGNGTVTAVVDAGTITDAVGNPSAASTSTDNTVTFDGNAPSVTINQATGQADPTNGAIVFDVVFSEATGDFDASDVVLSGVGSSGATALIAGGPSAYSVTVSGMSADGFVVANVAAGAISDAAGNTSAASTSTDNTVTFDGSAPTVTINQSTGQADPITSGTVSFEVQFSEMTSEFDQTDVLLSGTALPTTAQVTGSGSSYTVTVSGMTRAGSVIASIGAGAINDTVGNASAASTSTDNTVIYAALVTLSLSSSTIAENGGTLTLTATLSKTAGEDVTATIKFDGSATKGTDYSASPALAIVIPAGSTSATMTITALQDTVYDGTEVVRLIVADGIGGPAVKGSPISVTASFVDDDVAPVAALSAGASMLAENGSTQLTVTLDQAATVDTSVPIAYDSIALRNSDFTAATVIVVPTGSTSASITLAAIDDALLEGTERLRARIPPNTVSVLGSPSSLTIDIIDNDGTPPNATLSASASTLAENGGTLSLKVTLSSMAVADTRVSLQYAGSTSKADFTGASFIQVPLGQTTASITVTGVDDPIYENEVLKVKILSATNATFDPAQLSITMVDNDTAPVATLSFSAASMPETGGSVQLTATLDGPAPGPTSIAILYSGSASAADYVAVSSILIPTGATSASVTINSRSDASDEINEVIKAAVGPTSNAVAATATPVQVTILDDD
ncbi:MAG TPA: Calx-beta domain-containing protein [Solimonas sp.]|nr:Calx-beta domain-containing protein [Solimonas sp.]